MISYFTNIQCATLSKNYIDIMSEYNVQQIEYKDKCKARLETQLKISTLLSSSHITLLIYKLFDNYTYMSSISQFDLLACQKVSEEEIDEMLENGGPTPHVFSSGVNCANKLV